MAALMRFYVIWMICSSAVTTVSYQTKVQVYIGDEALLPCIYTSPLPQTVTISWRDKDNSNVLDIENSIPNLQTQSPKFKGRVKSFPDLYMKGNFSIGLQDVQHADAGVYECHIRVPDGSHQRIRLTVAGERFVAATPPPGPARGAAAVTPTSVQLMLLAAPLFLFCSLN